MPLHVIDMLIYEAARDGRIDVALEDGYELVQAGFNIGKHPSGHAGELADRHAVFSYRARLEELEDEIEFALRGMSPERLLELQQEADTIRGVLRSVLDIRGNARIGADDDEQARQSVAKAISRVRDKLWRIHPGLARHLFNG